MEALCVTGDPVRKSYIEALLNSAGIEYFVADESMSALYPNVGAIAERIMVAEADLAAAIRLLQDAEIERQL
jgi:hypothetical protein